MSAAAKPSKSTSSPKKVTEKPTDRPAVPAFGEYATVEEQKAAIQDISANPYYAGLAEQAKVKAAERAAAKAGAKADSKPLDQKPAKATKPTTSKSAATQPAKPAAAVAAPGMKKPSFPGTGATTPLDRILTYVLLGYGLFSVLSGYSTFLNMDQLMAGAIASLETQSSITLDEYTVTEMTVMVGYVLAATWTVLWLAGLVWSLRRIKAGKASFWIPVLMGVIANVFVTAGTITLLVMDPVFAQIMNSGAF